MKAQATYQLATWAVSALSHLHTLWNSKANKQPVATSLLPQFKELLGSLFCRLWPKLAPCAPDKRRGLGTINNLRATWPGLTILTEGEESFRREGVMCPHD